jgi:hypothetical protein
MNDGSSNEQELLRRLNNLETQNRRLRKIGLLVCAILGAVFWMGQARATRARVLEAGRFILRDARGRSLAELGIFPGGAALVFYDAKGSAALSIGNHEEGPGLTIMGADERRIATIHSTEAGPIFTLHDRDGAKRMNLSVTGQPSIGILSSGGEARGALGMTDEEHSFLQLFGEHERGGAQLFAASDRAMLRFLDSSDKARAAMGLLENEGTPGLTLNDADATPRVLFMLPPAGPSLTTLDMDRNVSWHAP